MQLFTRWAAFNAVGLAGMAVQLACLAALVHAGTHYLLATALAVEAAVIHNFLWHQRWTWRDRPASAPRALLTRLVRFHALNGLVSLAGNLALMALLAGRLHVDPILANVAAIVTCSLINFIASEALVFRSSTAAIALLLVAGSPSAASAGPGSSTVSAWHAYEGAANERYRSASPGGVFFRQDGRGSGWRDAARRGEVPTVRLDPPSPPGGRIHHWAGAVFIPGATVGEVVSRLQNFAGSEARAYTDVIGSKLLSREGDRLRVYMKLRRTTVITVTYHTEHEVEYRRLSHTRATSRSVATKIAELADAGTPREREKGPDEDHGFLWRLNAYWRYEQLEGGVLIECESLSLSRGVPALVRPVAAPIIDRVARESLVSTLTELRAFLTR